MGRASSRHPEPHQMTLLLWCFPRWKFSSHILKEGGSLLGPLYYAMPQFGIPFWFGPSSQFLSSAGLSRSPRSPSPHLGIPLSAPSCGTCIQIRYSLEYQVLSFCVCHLALQLQYLELHFRSLQLIYVLHFWLRFMCTCLCIMNGRGFFRTSGLHVAGRNSMY